MRRGHQFGQGAGVRLRGGAVFWAKAIQCVLLAAIAMAMLGSVHSQYDRVGGKLMCACGCGQMLLECNHLGCPDSPVMIQELRQQVASGAGDKEILAWFAAKYGPTVLAAPIRGGFDTVAWIAPFAIFVAAIAGTVAIVWMWKRRSHGLLTASGETDSGLAGAQLTPHEAALRDRIRRETEY